MNMRLFLTVILIIMPALGSSVAAQEHGPPAGGSDKNLREAASDLKGRSVEMERVRRDAEKGETEKRDNRPSASFSEIKEDFERIQIINNDVLQSGKSTGTPDYGRISEAAAEIKKRAIRLKSNLFQTESTKKPKETKPGPEDQDLKALIALLDDSITSFAHSAIFQNTKVVTPEDSVNAQKELDKVIKISDRILREVDRIKKASTPP